MTLTFTQKEVRKNRKKAREAEERYKKTGLKDFLSKRDEFNDIANKLESNMKTDIKKKKGKPQIKISDEQAFSEAQAYNRKNKKKVEEESQKTSEKNEQMKNRREQLLKGIREKEKAQKEFIEKHRSQQEIQEKQMKEYREEKVKEYMKENPNASESEAQKAFVRNHNKMMEYLTAKEEIIHKLMMLGMERVEAEEKFKEIIKRRNEE